MKVRVLQIGLLALLQIVANPCHLHAQQKKVNIQVTGSDNQLMYAGNEIRKAAVENKYTATGTSFLNDKASEEIVVRIVSDSATSVKVANDNRLRKPENFGWQAYAIRIKNNGRQRNIYVLASDKTGAMYGCFDIAEALRIYTINTITDSDNKPYLDRRGIKFKAMTYFVGVRYYKKSHQFYRWLLNFTYSLAAYKSA
jgi:hypothetical protein